MNELAIVGREEEMCEHILGELRATYQETEILSIPFIRSVGIPFQLPQSDRKQMFIFTSPRAVGHFLEYTPIPFGSEVATLGHRTTRTLCSYGIEPNITGRFENTFNLTSELLNYMRYTASSYQLILPTYGNGTHHYGDALRDHGVDFITLPVYKVVPHPELPVRLSKLDDMPEWVLFFSPSSVVAWATATNCRPTAFNADHPTTLELERFGFRNVYESPSPHHSDLLTTILKFKSPFRSR